MQSGQHRGPKSRSYNRGTNTNSWNPLTHPKNVQTTIRGTGETPITGNTTHHTPTSPRITIGSSDNSSKDRVEEITIQNNRRGTQLDILTTSTDENNPNSKKTHPHNVQNTIVDIRETPIIENTTHVAPAPTIITIRSSEDGSENDREEITIREDQSEVSNPHLKHKTGEQPPTLAGNNTDKKSQDAITIDRRDQSSHQGITILENTDQNVTPNEIRITTQNPTTITIVSKYTNVPEQDDSTQPLHKTSAHRDSNNNVQANFRPIIPTQQQESNVPTSQAATRGRCDDTLHRLAPMGQSNSQIHQTSPCRTHPHCDSQNIRDNTTNPAWELAQTKDPQGINNFHQDSNGKLITTDSGSPQCNYCKLPNHARQRCAFRLKDLDYNIDRQVHPRKGFLTKYEARNYLPPPRHHRSPMSLRLATESDSSGHSRFWQTRSGHIIYSIDNQPQCSYCGIPSYGRDTCPHRRKDETKGLFRTHHPQRGMIYEPQDTSDPIQSRSSYTSTSYGHLNSKYAQGINNYQLTNDGKPIVNPKGHILCNYCGVPSHPQATCTTRIRDEVNSIRREIHPNRGLIPSGNQVGRQKQ